jgi:hypothetical protein
MKEYIEDWTGVLQKYLQTDLLKHSIPH